MIRRFASIAAGLILLGWAGRSDALILTIEEEFPIADVPTDAEGVAAIYSGPNAGIYIVDDASGQATVLDIDTGAVRYRFNTLLGAEVRSIDVLPNGNLIMGVHDTNLVREIVIPANPGDSTIPNATLGTIQFSLPLHPNNSQPFDEFESLAAFERPSDGAVFLLIGEEGRPAPVPPGGELPGELYIAQVAGSGITGFTKLFSLPLPDNFDDMSGLDVINIAFDTGGNVDLANSRVIMTDDSSGGDSTAYVLDLTGQILETLDGPGGGTLQNFESYFDPDGSGPEVGPMWRDAEGADYDPATGRLIVFISDGASGTPALVRFTTSLEVPVPEPTLLGLLALPLALLALRRRA